MPRTSWNELRRYRVFKPASEFEQSRIAVVLGTVDVAIAKREAVIAKLRQVRAGLLHDLLTCGLDPSGQLRDSIAHPEQFQDSPLGRIPKKWTTPTLVHLCSHIGSGVTPRGGQDIYTARGVLFIRSLSTGCSLTMLPTSRTRFTSVCCAVKSSHTMCCSTSPEHPSAVVAQCQRDWAHRM